MLAHLHAPLSADIARARAKWGDHRLGIFLGTSNAGILQTESADTIRRATGNLPPTYDFSRQHAYGGGLALLRSLTGAAGPGWVNSAACASAAKALASAHRLIEADVLDAAIVGGADTLCQTTLRGFHGLGVLSAQKCQPFSAQRAGINLGEGGALFLLERQGNALGQLLAVGESCDAHHMSAPHPQGDGAFLAMERALQRAEVAPASIDHVNAHGTATRQNDAAEALAIFRLLGPQVPVASTKGYTGHLLGAAAAIELAISLHTLQTGLIPQTLGAIPVDPELQIAVTMTQAKREVRFLLSNSLGFGGNNASILLGRA